MLELFIVEANQPKSNAVKTVESFKGRLKSFRTIKDFSEINETVKRAEWFGVFYDDEIISDEILNALPAFFQYENHDVLLAYRKGLDEKMSISPRFFRDYIEIDSSALKPINGKFKREIILDGWILENAD